MRTKALTPLEPPLERLKRGNRVGNLVAVSVNIDFLLWYVLCTQGRLPVCELISVYGLLVPAARFSTC